MLNIDYALAFSVSNLGPKRFQRILNEFDSLEKGWNASREDLARLEIVGKTFEKFEEFRKSFDHVRYTGQLEKAKVEFVSFLDARYPVSLKRIENPPIGLFCKGNLELLYGSGARHSWDLETPESQDPGQARMTLRQVQGELNGKIGSGEMDPRFHYKSTTYFIGSREDDKLIDKSVIPDLLALSLIEGIGNLDKEIAAPRLDETRNDFLKIAVVGTRKVTEYGKDATEFLVSELVKSEVCIVSGLALGIDATAHRAAVTNHGRTIAVLACGVDCCLPSENYSLYRSILENGGLIISEYPLSQPPNKGTFLARNRIIAALSDGVLVTEAAVGSGSLVTAEYGFTYGKKVFAVPGRINSQMAKGSLSLIKKGAHSASSGQAIMVLEAGDILQEFKIESSKLRINTQRLKNLNDDERKIVSLLESEDLTVDEIIRKTGPPISQLFGLISGLELKGIIKNSGGKIGLKNH